MSETLGDRLRQLRKRSGKKQDAVALALGVNAGTYSRWERDTAKPHADEIVALAHYYAVTTDHLLLGEPLPDEKLPIELHRFLATQLGRRAQQRGLVAMLKQIRLPYPPSVQTYKRIVTTYLLLEENEEAESGESDSS